ncbi:hypothetical protein Taro_048739 [Colocasia esculenta]|uniref:Uncharacterized protein n=1 Tax=Colocasia esculenta TaxID=4460 RepID=A0A843X8Z6_COLES|nr:hypothetical protein [Colocasia esculenta]
MDAGYWLAAIPLDADSYRRPHPWTSACGWRPDRWTSTGFAWSAQLTRDSSPLAPFSRPCNACSRSQREHCERDRGALLLWPTEEGEVGAPISACCVRPLHRRDHSNPLGTVNLVNRGVNQVNQQSIVANERPVTFTSSRRTSTVDNGDMAGRRNGSSTILSSH